MLKQEQELASADSGTAGVEIEFRVRYYETDAMGIVHHSNYLRWFELGRTEYLRSVGLPYRTLEDRGVNSPVIGIRCRYLHPARYDDLIQLKTWVQDYTGIRLVMGYEVSCEGRLICAGESEHAFTSQKKTVAPVRSLPDVHAVMLDCRRRDLSLAKRSGRRL